MAQTPELVNGKYVVFCTAAELQEEILRLRKQRSTIVGALKECLPFCKGHRETPRNVARYERVVAALSLAKQAP